MKPGLSDSALHEVLHALCYPSNRIVWAIEILQGRVDLASIRCDHHPVDRKAYSIERSLTPYRSLTDEQITEAASYAAMEDLRRDIRCKQENA